MDAQVRERAIVSSCEMAERALWSMQEHGGHKIGLGARLFVMLERACDELKGVEDWEPDGMFWSRMARVSTMVMVCDAWMVEDTLQ